MPFSTRRMAVLFVCAIVLPTMVLAYLGLQVDGERLDTEPRRLAALGRQRADALIAGGLADLRRWAADPDASLSAPILRHPFRLDATRAWQVPLLREPRGVVLPRADAAALEVARRIELAAGDPGRALPLYLNLATGALNLATGALNLATGALNLATGALNLATGALELPTGALERAAGDAHSRDAAAQDPPAGHLRGDEARAIALHAAARCARKIGDTATALEATLRLLTDHPHARDESGDILATYAALLRAELQRDVSQPAAAVATLSTWLADIEAGRLPVHEGSTFHLERAADLVAAARGAEATVAAEDLVTRIHAEIDRLHFLTTHGTAIRQPHLPANAWAPQTGAALFRSGQAGDAPWLATVVRAPASTSMAAFAGAEVDLQAITTELQALLEAAGAADAYRLEILDDRGAADFVRTHGADVAHVARLSDLGVGLRLGLAARDTEQLRRRERNRRWLLAASVVLLTATIGFGGYLLVRDAARERHLSRLRADFVSSVSHELRTPLSSIRLFAETLQMGRFASDAERADCLDAIVQESDRLSRLVDDVLEFSRIERGTHSYHLEPADLVEVCRGCVDLLRPRLERKGVRLDVALDAAELTLPLDRDAVTQAILNLIGNATKYSPRDRWVGVRVYADAGGGGAVEVADRGVGIPAAEQARIFEPFYRADTGSLRVSGAGLGLTVVHHVMAGHGGRVEVDSHVGAGATFRLHFPPSAEV